MTFGQRLAGLMQKKGVTQYRLSKDMGCSNSTIANWRNDAAQPVGEKLKKLADYFNISIDYLLRGETDNPAPESIGRADIDFAFLSETQDLTEEQKQEILDFIRWKKSQKKR